MLPVVTAPCTVVYYHHPFVNIGNEGDSTRMSSMWSLFAQKNAVKRTVDELMSNGSYDGLAAYEKIMNKLDKVAQRIKNATQGYSGMFDTMPLIRYFPGECGFVIAFARRFSGRWFSQAHCANPMKNR